MENREDESVPKLLRDLSNEMTTLVHQEIDLAKVELSAKAKRAGLGAGFFGGAGVVGVLGAAVLVAAAVAGLANLIPVWAAALAIGGALLMVGGLLSLVGRKELVQGMPPAPTEAIESTKEDIEWIKTRTRSATP